MEARGIPYTVEKSQTSELDGLIDLVLVTIGVGWDEESIEDEAAALREMQAKVEKDMGPQGLFWFWFVSGRFKFFCNSTVYSILFAVPVTIAADQAGKEEVDARSVFVGNVRTLMCL